MPRLHMSGSREVISALAEARRRIAGRFPSPRVTPPGFSEGVGDAPAFYVMRQCGLPRERAFSRPLLVRLGDEEDDLPLAVEP